MFPMRKSTEGKRCCPVCWECDDSMWNGDVPNWCLGGELLSPELQNIIEKYRDNFNGVKVTLNDDLDGEKTYSDNDN